MNTKEKLKLILQEWWEYDLPTTYTRKFDMSYLDHDEILSIIGARRAGKTHLCYQIIKELRKNTDIPPHNILYINFEDERLYPLNGDELTLLLDIYREMFNVDMQKKVYLFVDEIHNIENWSKWARRINERYKNIKLIITGSSAKLLSHEIATELRGRTISFNIFPLSFAEYVNANNITFDPKNILYSQDRFQIKKLFNNYVQNGGFPATLASPKPEELLKEYYEVMFYRDIVERHSVTNIKLLEDYLALLIDQTACKFSISKTAVKLQEIGYSFSKSTLSNFLNYAEEAELLFPVKKYNFKLREQMRSAQKIYAIDHGLLQTIRFGFMENIGRILENIVYLELRRSNTSKNIFYYQGDKECDFLARQKNKVTAAIQVSQNISSPETNKREIDGLLEAMQALKLKNGLILTEDEKDTIQIDNCLIEVLPIWYWLLAQ
ncbi:MAG: ATP-binding protein [Gammaproteobacteria bacterium]